MHSEVATREREGPIGICRSHGSGEWSSHWMSSCLQIRGFFLYQWSATPANPATDERIPTRSVVV